MRQVMKNAVAALRTEGREQMPRNRSGLKQDLYRQPLTLSELMIREPGQSLKCHAPGVPAAL